LVAGVETSTQLCGNSKSSMSLAPVGLNHRPSVTRSKTGGAF
jgi:hypothetical protein